MEFPPLELAELGCRICILGPSNSGKSTLAAAIGRRLDLNVVHLDRLYHVPETNWIVRPEEQFLALHDQAIAGECWVIEGNYSVCLPQRLVRATGLILLDISTQTSLGRYLRRTLLEDQRVGALQGGQDSVKWGMIRHILVTTPATRKRYSQMFSELSLPKVKLASMGRMKQAMRDWGLES